MCAEFVLGNPQQRQDEDHTEQPPSPAPSEHGSFTSSISRFRYSQVALSALWVDAFSIGVA